VDITADGAVDRVAATAPEVLGSVDLLVNNAGNVRAGRLEDHDVADVRAMIDLNLTAPILLTRAMLPPLRAGAVPGGSVVLNIAVASHSSGCRSTPPMRPPRGSGAFRGGPTA
jgi:NAD(P)-dependent dehydrogenase (short-subunit alcohol dehydrogenase family)